MDNQLFYSLGLTGNETKIYLKLLDLGIAYAGQLTEKSGIHRRNVYDAIDRLLEKGLVSYVTVNNRKLFSPANPRRFISIIEERKNELGNIKKKFIKMLPELELGTELHERHDVRFFKGVEGLKSVFEDILRTCKDYIGFGLGYQLESLLKHYSKQFAGKRVKAKIKIRLIYGEDSRYKIEKSPLSEIRYIPKQYSSNSTMRIYGDKIAIMLLSEEPVAVVIKNKEIADGYRKYFEVMWKYAKP